MANYLVNFQDAVGTVGIRLNNRESLQTVVNSLRAVTGRMNASACATDFLLRYSGQATVNNPGERLTNGYSITYNVNSGNLLILNINYSIHTPVYNGPLKLYGSIKAASVEADLRSAINKILRFTYRSSEGTTNRVVKLTSVSGSGANTLLRGWDVNKSTREKLEYRTFKVGNIVGGVEVVD